jgi:NadR type nicotinamide-nucleotide adenylyltransferase
MCGVEGGLCGVGAAQVVEVQPPIDGIPEDRIEGAGVVIGRPDDEPIARVIAGDRVAEEVGSPGGVRGYFVNRVCVVGAESTGKSTLARSLAEHYKTVWAPEYGRMYAEGKLTAEREIWGSAEFERIAAAQNELENSLAERANGLLICDTDAFDTSVWHERYMGKRSPRVEELGKICAHDLYIVTGDEIPFVQDGTRDGEHIRHWMHQRFIERLKEDNKPFIIVSGSEEARLQAAIKAIDQL